MCGIAGIANSQPCDPVSSDLIHQMCGAMIHRGPDDSGNFVFGPVGIGMRRLSIIDLQTGNQPIANEDKTIWVVFNGEIYNYRELRKKLEASGHRFQTTTDTEVIVHLFEDFGENCVNHLRGMFAFALWDARSEVLVLARDRLGIKPLYFAELPEGLIFGSELKALLAHPHIPRDLNIDALAEYFTHLCVPGDQSIFQAVRKLPPAHLLTYRHGRARMSRYWNVQPDPMDGRGEDAWVQELRERLREAVNIHLVADVPVGAFLSGGLDSGAMVGLMASASAEPIRTFTVGFASDAGRFDERVPAQAVATLYATVHQDCFVEANIAEILPHIVHTFDEPFADSSAIPNWLICQETARHVKVALSGLGGDELFGGYERYAGLQLGERYQYIPRLMRRAITRLVHSLPNGNGLSYFGDRLKRFVATGELTPAQRYRSFIAAFWDPKEILHPDHHASLSGLTSRYDQVISGLTMHHTLDLALFADLYLYLPDDLLTLTDRLSMAHSLEVRVPFLDHELVEFVARIPMAFKVRGLQKKYLFRRAVAPWVPKGHLNRPKQGFSVPMAFWLRGSLRPMLRDLVEGRELQDSPWLNHTAVRKLANEHLSGIANHEVRLWAILCFREWERQYTEIQAASA